MVLFLRDDRNRTIIEVELFKKQREDSNKTGYIELSSAVCINTYSKLLLETHSDNSHNTPAFIEAFDSLNELRGWLWESYFVGEDNTVDEYDNVLKEVREKLHKVAKDYGLIYVED